MLPESISEVKEGEGDEDVEGEESILKHGGRIYHQADERLHGGYGLIRSTLAQEIGNYFLLDERRLPVAFKWKGKSYQLSNQLAQKIRK